MPTSPTPNPAPPLSPGRLAVVARPAGYSYLFSQPSAGATSARSSASAQRWPLLLFLHGIRECGSDPVAIVRQGLPKLLAEAPDLSPAARRVGASVAQQFIFVAPQCPHYEVWDDRTLSALLDDVLTRYPIDPQRVYLTGLSLGGFGVWTLGLRQPGRFAAIVPVCGGGRIGDVERTSQSHGAALRSLGVWAFHGARDRVVPVDESQRMIDALQHAGLADARLTVYPEVEHDAWTPAYETPELYPWLLRHTR